MDPAKVTDDPIQLADTLRVFAELRQSNAITDADYDRVKSGVLAAVEQRVKPRPIEAPPPLQGNQDFAGDIHRLIAGKLSQEYPGGEQPSQDEHKRYLMEVAAQLIAKDALHPSDMSYMTKVIETAVDQSYAGSPQKLAQGLIQLNAIHKEVRLSADTSPLARTITGIASDSAEKAVDAEANAPTSSDTQTAQQTAQKRRTRWWGAVTADVGGAFTGAGTAATILAAPGFPIASVAVLGAVGPAAAVVPVLGALIGAGMMSGIDLARTRS